MFQLLLFPKKTYAAIWIPEQPAKFQMVDDRLMEEAVPDNNGIPSAGAHLFCDVSGAGNECMHGVSDRGILDANPGRVSRAERLNAHNSIARRARKLSKGAIETHRKAEPLGEPSELIEVLEGNPTIHSRA